MPQPYPGQQWKHGWKPLTPGAAREKNHGRKPGRNSAITRLVAEAAEIHNRMKAENTAKKQDSATATTKSAPKSAAKPKPGKKVGADSRNAPLREGDDVTITTGPDRGKTGKVAGKGRYGAVKVEVDGKTSDMSPANIRSKTAQETSKKADEAIRNRTGRTPAQNTDATPARPRSPQPPEKVESDVRDAYARLVRRPGTDFASITDLRRALGDLPRQDVDAALKRLIRQRGVLIVPESNQKTLTPADREAAVAIGDQPKHLILIQR